MTIANIVCCLIGHKWPVTFLRYPSGRINVSAYEVIGHCDRCGKDGTGKILKPMPR